MNEAVRSLPENRRNDFLGELAKVTGAATMWEMITATPRQMAEAFLRTLNLWKD
jgi:hypothetical protein